ncbi:hypothetical protein TYRP_005432 [Tyrophagus putrescentiae]|nr:hypothetical protein TYRP_005432 [Tyrophagus putrescentiae]
MFRLVLMETIGQGASSGARQNGTFHRQHSSKAAFTDSEGNGYDAAAEKLGQAVLFGEVVVGNREHHQRPNGKHKKSEESGNDPGGTGDLLLLLLNILAVDAFKRAECLVLGRLGLK